MYSRKIPRLTVSRLRYLIVFSLFQIGKYDIILIRITKGVLLLANKHLKRTILEVVDNQLRANDPPITRFTLDRLMGLGYSEKQAKEKIGSVINGEIYDVLKNSEPFDEARYIGEMNKLM